MGALLVHDFVIPEDGHRSHYVVETEGGLQNYDCEVCTLREEHGVRTKIPQEASMWETLRMLALADVPDYQIPHPVMGKRVSGSVEAVLEARAAWRHVSEMTQRVVSALAKSASNGFQPVGYEPLDY